MKYRTEKGVRAPVAHGLAARRPALAEAVEQRRLLSVVPEVVDLLAVYTPGAAANLGGDAQLIARLKQSIDSTNQALINSEISITIRLIAAETIAYTGSDNLYLDRVRLHDQGDGFLDSAHVRRNQLGADLVTLVVDGPNVGGGNGDLLENIADPDNDDRAFSAIAWNSIGGGNLTLAHELGHNLGGGHERGNPIEPVVGPFSYSYGYRFNVGAVAHHDIMSYDPGWVVPHFANPAVSYRGTPTGAPIGTANEADLASTFAVTGPLVASYRSIVVNDVSAPSASIYELSQGGTSTLTFTIKYLDDSGVDPATIDSSDLTVSGPGGFALPAALLSIDHPAHNGAFKLATYRITLPANQPSIDSLSFNLKPNAVRDINGLAVPSGAIAKNTSDSASWSFAEARELGTLATSESARVVYDSVSPLDTDDIYRFSLTGTSNVGASLTGLTSDANVYFARDVNGNGTYDGGDEFLGGSFESSAAPDGVGLPNFAAGQYFVWVYSQTGAALTPYTLTLRAYGDSTAPSATLDATDVTTAGAPYADLAITYSDDFLLDGETTRYWSAIDITVAYDGGGGFTFHYFPDFTLNSPGTADVPSRTIYYRIFAFNSETGWTSADTGTYTIGIHANTAPDPRVHDSAGNNLPLTTLGSFRIDVGANDITLPTASFAAGNPAPIAGQTTWDFQVSYRDNIALNGSTIDGSDVRVTGPGGFNQPASLVSLSAAPSIGSNRVATYRVNAPGGFWDATDDGSYTVALQADQVRDSTGNSAAAATLATVSASMPQIAALGPGSVAFIGTSGVDTMTFDADAVFDYFDLNTQAVYFIPRSFVTRATASALGGADAIRFRSGAWTGVVAGGAGANTLAVSSGASLTLDTDAGASASDLSATVDAGGSVAFSATQHLAALAVFGNASVPVNGGRRIVTRSLSISGAGALDLCDNDLVLEYSGASQLSAIQSLIAAARNFGAWDQPGLTSSSARLHPQQATMLGVMSSADFFSIYGPGTPFEGEPIDSTAVLVKYTWYGDADFNGVVDFDDYVRADSGFNGSLGGWMNGDFDLSGFVDFDDYVLIDLGFNSQSAVL